MDEQVLCVPPRILRHGSLFAATDLSAAQFSVELGIPIYLLKVLEKLELTPSSYELCDGAAGLLSMWERQLLPERLSATR
jgi:hypothetical protein